MGRKIVVCWDGFFNSLTCDRGPNDWCHFGAGMDCHTQNCICSRDGGADPTSGATPGGANTTVNSHNRNTQTPRQPTAYTVSGNDPSTSPNPKRSRRPNSNPRPRTPNM